MPDLSTYLGIIIIFIIIILSSAIRILREYERGVIFRLGRLIGAKGPGLILLIPVVDRMVRVSLRTVVMDVAPQDVITKDNVSLKVKPNLRKTLCIALRKLHQISQIYSISGEYDLLVTIQAKNLEKLNAVLNTVCSLEGVERTNSSIILDTIFER